MCPQDYIDESNQNVKSGVTMTMADYVDDIDFQISGGLLELEIRNQLPKCVNKAFREIKRYMSTPRFKTVPYANSIDCSNLNVYTIRSVMRSAPIYGTHYGSGDVDVFSLAAGALSSVDPTYYMNRMMLIQQRNTISTDLDHIWEPETKMLRLSVNPPFPPAVTIEYVYDYKNVDEVTEPYWQDWILQLATGYAKVITGRIRSKYTLKSAQYELDGKDLVAEGNAEIAHVREFLRANAEPLDPHD